MTSDLVVEIPYKALSAGALQGIIEEFITREGTDYGQQEYSLEQKVQQVIVQLEKGIAKIIYDDTTESCQLITV